MGAGECEEWVRGSVNDECGGVLTMSAGEC